MNVISESGIEEMERDDGEEREAHANIIFTVCRNRKEAPFNTPII